MLKKELCYRSWTMRASDLSQDRCDLQFAVKELARRMQQPNTKNMQAIKRLVRFLAGSPRCLIVHGRQAEQPVVDAFSDSERLGGMYEEPVVDFVFVCDAGTSGSFCVSHCSLWFVDNLSVC